MLSLVLSTVAFFVASHFIKRHFDAMTLPKGMTRSILVFSLALAISYVIALIADKLFD